MKMLLKKSVCLTLTMMFFYGSTFAQSVGINADGSTPNSKAMQDVKSNFRGLLPASFTYAERMAITGVPAGLIVWCSDCGASGELQVYNGTTWMNLIGGSASVPIAIGQSYGGGIIFYIDGTGKHGLIAATSDQTTGIIWAVPAYKSTLVPGGTSTAIGTGSTNSNMIIAQNGANRAYAAGLARGYTGGGYNDWFLPSKDELNQMYLQKTVIGGFSSDYYWSSSESKANSTWFQSFGLGAQYDYNKNYTACVRAVRAF
ncbi:MAG: DUF1566 domain-containing protein [Bacteroidota bacterium]